MADIRDGRLPRSRRQRHRLQFAEAAPPATAVPRRTQVIIPKTTDRSERNERNERSHGNITHQTFQFEQTLPTHQTLPSSKKDTRLRPYVATPPPNAATYPKGKFADFYPWVLNPAEEAVTEQQARSGHFDKLHSAAGKNESVSARPVLQQILKQKAGLPALSSLFLSVLEKRNDLNNITTPSTFKPPPRVSLVDTRRESWLEDLANPAVPLRKLSRTIPHGIRGRALLDQCLAKNIPLNRAVWFARCVGANELRGLKRKGTGSFVASEVRWVREWTISLAQFVESNLTEPAKVDYGMSDRKRINYVLRLAGYLHMEKLVDTTTFIEFHLQFLSRCGPDKLPAALLMCGTLQKDIFADRVYGRRFYAALLVAVKSIFELKHRHIYTPLVQKISATLRTYLLYNMEALILPPSWETLKSSLLLSVNWWNPQTGCCLRNADTRNKILAAPVTTTPSSTTDSVASILLILDRIPSPFIPKVLLSECEAICADYCKLIDTVVEWAVSSFRAGIYRVYIACQILRIAKAKLGDIQSLVLESFEARMMNSPEKLRIFYHLVSELTRMRIFSIAQFVKWAVVRGALRAQSPHIQLLSELPLIDLPPNIKNLRNTLLATAGFDVSNEQWLLENTKKLLSEKLSQLTVESKRASVHDLLDPAEIDFLKNMSRAITTELSSWLKRSIQAIFDGSVPNSTSWSPAMSNNSNPASGPAFEAFLFCTSALELFDDMRTLAEVVSQSSCSNNEDVLCYAAELTALHFESFSALGEGLTCLLFLFNKYKMLKTNTYIPHKLCRLLFELASYSGQDPAIIAELNQDMYQFILSIPLPKSMKPDGAGGELSLVHIFNSCVTALELQRDGDNQEVFLTLMKLRQVDDKAYSELIKQWASKTLSGADRNIAVQRVAQAISWSCIGLDILVAAVMQAQSSLKNDIQSRNQVTDLSLDTLSLLLGDCSNVELDSLARISIRAKSELFLLNNPRDLLGLLHLCITLALSRPDSIQAHRLRTILASPALIYVLRRICSCNSQMVATYLVNPVLMEGEDASKALINVLNLLLHKANAEPETSLTGEFCNVLDVIDNLSISLCELKVRILCDGIGELPNGGQFVEGLGKTIDRERVVNLLESFPRKCSAITSLLGRLDSRCKHKVYWFAEQLLLHSDMQHGLPSSVSDLELKQNEKYTLAQFILCILEEASPPATLIHTAPELIDRMSQIISKLSSARATFGSPSPSSAKTPGGFSISSLWIRSLISDLVKYQALLSKESNIPSEIGFLIFNFVSFLQKSSVYAEDSLLMDTIYDVCGALIDVCPPEILNSLRVYLRDRRVCPRVNYLFGLPSSSERWLKSFQPSHNRALDFPIKAWEKLAEPSPNPGENDVCISLTLFAARKVRCST